MTYTKVILVVVVFLSTAAFAKAQDNLSPEKVVELTELHENIIGTYQIQVNARRMQPAIELSTIEDIQRLRSDTEITFLILSPEIRILILPKSTIESKGFQPPQRISYRYTDEPAY